MAMDERRKYELIVKVFEVLYVVFGGKRKTHTEVTDRAKMLFPIVVAEDIIETDKEEIIFAAVAMFEREVGIKVYTPTIIDNDYDSDLWLYRVKPTIAHSYFDRYKLYLTCFFIKKTYAAAVAKSKQAVTERYLNRSGNA